MVQTLPWTAYSHFYPFPKPLLSWIKLNSKGDALQQWDVSLDHAQVTFAFSTNLGYDFANFCAVYHWIQLTMPLTLLTFGLSLTQNLPWPTLLEDV